MIPSSDQQAHHIRVGKWVGCNKALDIAYDLHRYHADEVLPSLLPDRVRLVCRDVQLQDLAPPFPRASGIDLVVKD
jgi:hypothetical protein